MMNILAAVYFAEYFLFAVIMSEIHPADHKSIIARNFPEEGFREADCEFSESEKHYKRVEAEFSRVHELNKQQDCVHNVWCLDPVNIERTSLSIPEKLYVQDKHQILSHEKVFRVANLYHNVPY